MHKPFYASGFLYHPSSQQILLQQFGNGDETKLTLFRGKSVNGSDPQVVFKQCVEEALGVTIDSSTIRPVYDYTHDKLGEHYIFFAEVSDTVPETYASKNKTEWFSLSKLGKYAMSEQTRHDIVIGVRVIRAIFEAANPQPNPRRHH